MGLKRTFKSTKELKRYGYVVQSGGKAAIHKKHGRKSVRHKCEVCGTWFTQGYERYRKQMCKKCWLAAD